MTPEELLDMLLSDRIPKYGRQHGHLRCDACYADIRQPAHVGLYASTLGTDDDEPFRLHITFCGDCQTDEIPAPRLGLTELLLTARVVDEGGLPKLVEPSIADTSKATTGLPWDYGQVWENLTGIPFNQIQMEDSASTPAHVWGVLNACGVDVREVLNDEGEYDVAADREAELKEEVKGQFLKMATRMQ